MWFVDNHGCLRYMRTAAVLLLYLLALEEERRSAEAERGPVPDLEPHALGADRVLGHDDSFVVTLGHLDRLLLDAIIVVRVYTVASLEQACCSSGL